MEFGKSFIDNGAFLIVLCLFYYLFGVQPTIEMMAGGAALMIVVGIILLWWKI